LTFADAGQGIRKMLNGSNQRHERFAQLAASGETGTAAYRVAYGAEGASAEVGASRLLRNDKVSERIAEFQRESATATTLNMQRRREILAEIAENKLAKDADRINAVLADAKLAGELNGICATVSADAPAGANAITEERRAELIKKRREANERLKAARLARETQEREEHCAAESITGFVAR
jgi:hypothetical protein